MNFSFLIGEWKARIRSPLKPLLALKVNNPYCTLAGVLGPKYDVIKGNKQNGK